MFFAVLGVVALAGREPDVPVQLSFHDVRGAPLESVRWTLDGRRAHQSGHGAVERMVFPGSVHLVAECEGFAPLELQVRVDRDGWVERLVMDPMPTGRVDVEVRDAVTGTLLVVGIRTWDDGWAGAFPHPFVEDLADGSHRLVVHVPGYADVEEDVLVRGGRYKRVDVWMTPVAVASTGP